MNTKKFKIKNIPHYIYWININLSTRSIGKINYIRAWYWGVKLGRKCQFYGHAYFFRHRDSSITIGDNCQLFSKIRANLYNRPCSIMTHSTEAKIEIGNSVGMSGTIIVAEKSIKIGDNVRFGANTFVFDTDFHSEDPRVKDPKEVLIEDNVWLGMNVVVLKGVTIGKNSLIGAGSVVTKNIPANVIASGNPCRIIKEIA